MTRDLPIETFLSHRLLCVTGDCFAQNARRSIIEVSAKAIHPSHALASQRVLSHRLLCVTGDCFTLPGLAEADNGEGETYIKAFDPPR